MFIFKYTKKSECKQVACIHTVKRLTDEVSDGKCAKFPFLSSIYLFFADFLGFF